MRLLLSSQTVKVKQVKKHKNRREAKASHTPDTFKNIYENWSVCYLWSAADIYAHQIKYASPPANATGRTRVIIVTKTKTNEIKTFRKYEKTNNVVNLQNMGQRGCDNVVFGILVWKCYILMLKLVKTRSMRKLCCICLLKRGCRHDRVHCLHRVFYVFVILWNSCKFPP